ncbi:hypothetical protein HCN44_008514 [Aphidius gifuensis]|uniref:Odorant receptor n=1 Tax=Aphidius gifuensis TaxID=684658 RepID=A0A835CR57_APHGI|nr:hypothetical protein HCN44_008514 [Aphidius gifuensis]
MQVHRLNSMILKILGVWKPYKDRYYIFKFYKINLTIFIFIFMIAQFVTVLNEDTAKIWDRKIAFSVGFISLMGLIKRLNIMYQQKNITDIFETLKNDKPFKIEDQSEKNIQDYHYRCLKRLTLIFTSCAVIGAILHLGKKLNSHELPILPFGTGILVEISNQFFYKLMSYILTTLSFIGILMTVSYNTLFFTMMMIICSQVDVLKYRYQIMVENLKINRSDDQNIDDKLIIEKKIITDFVDNHSEVLEMSQKICDIFSTIIFMQYAYSTIGLCLSSYVLTRDILLSAEFLSHTIIPSLYALEISLICYISNEMKNQYEELYDAIYDVDWTNFDQSTKKSMMILMMKTREPFFFKCGKLFEPSRESLLAVCTIFILIFHLIQY